MSAVMPTVALDKSRGTMVVSIPVSFVQRGGRKQIVVPVGAEDWIARSKLSSQHRDRNRPCEGLPLASAVGRR